MVDDKLIFDLLERPAVLVGRRVVVLMPDFGVRAIEFDAYPACLHSLSPTPWKYSWVGRGRLWYHLNRSTRRCQVIDESSLPVYRDSGTVYPGTWLVEDRLNDAILGSNAFGGAHPQLGITTRSGFHLYSLSDDRLDLLNQEPIPYLIWCAWREGDSIILGGMTERGGSAVSDGTTADTPLGRPILLRCSLISERWEEIELTGASKRRTEELNECFEELGLDRRFKFEAWVGIGKISGGGRILIAAFAKKGTSIFDNPADLPIRPLATDYSALAFVSYEKGEVLRVETSARLIHILHAPQGSLFIICHGFEQGGQRVGELSILDIESHGLSAQKISIDGVSPLAVFSSFTGAYFGQEGFFGALTCEDDTFFVHSVNGVNWKALGTSGDIEYKLASDCK